jgi:hypothetical protein
MKISQPLGRVKASAELDQLVTQLFTHYGELTKPRLAQLTGKHVTSFEHCLPRLIESGFIHSFRVKNRVFYRLGKASNQPQAQRFNPTGTYTGDGFNPAVNRPGCLDFLLCPSLMGDKRMPYRPPMHGCVSTANNFNAQA